MDEDDDGCICDFPPTCDGNGVLACEGCGGDFCVCGVCNGHGEVECPGCSDCLDRDLDSPHEETV